MLHSHALLPILTYNHVYFAVGFEGQDGSQPPKHCRGVILFFPRLPAEEWLSLGFPQSAAGSTDSSKLWGEGCQPPSKADFSSLKICHGQLCTLQISSPFRQLIPKSLSSMQMSYFLTMFQKLEQQGRRFLTLGFSIASVFCFLLLWLSFPLPSTPQQRNCLEISSISASIKAFIRPRGCVHAVRSSHKGESLSQLLSVRLDGTRKPVVPFTPLQISRTFSFSGFFSYRYSPDIPAATTYIQRV